MKKVLSAILLVASVFIAACAQKPSDGKVIENVTAYTTVGDLGLNVYALDIKVNRPKVLKKLTAEDFDLVNNGYAGYCDPETQKQAEEYADDGISASVKKDVLHLQFKPFAMNGLMVNFRSTPWELHCTDSTLNITAEDIDETRIDIIDDCIRGKFTYAGITREYMLYLPKDDDTGQIIRNVPLLVWQLGGGEYDRDMMTVALANRGLTSLPEQGFKCATLQFAVANPNYSYSASLDPEKIKLIDRNNALQMAFIDSLIAADVVDGNRIFCAGASSGGGCTMRFMMQFADRFKAAIPCCSMDPIVPIHMVQDLDRNKLEKDLNEAFRGQVYRWNGTDMELSPINTGAFVNLPMYFVHAKADNTCKVISSEAYYEVRKALGAKDDVLRIYDEKEMNEYGMGGPIFSHFSWVRLLNDYSEGSAMNWLVNQF